MYKKIIIVCLSLYLCIPYVSYAFDITAILDIIAKVYGVNLDMKDSNAEQVEKLGDIKSRLDDINAGLRGKHNYGSNYYSENNYGWGESANSWQSTLSMADKGRGDGQLGDLVNQYSKQFPMVSSGLGSTNTIENQYYKLEAQNALASRSTSEVAYKQAVEAEKTLNKLHGLIDQTPDSKSSSDLNNRLVSESTMNNIQQTKLLAILVQQSAMATQNQANRAKEDKEFFDIR